MQSSRRTLHQLWAGNGFVAVALGAFGAHGLKTQLAGMPDAARRLEWWQTASHYHLFHALALGLLATLVGSRPSFWERLAETSFVAGIALFSGSLYVMALTGQTGIAVVTPLGGLGLLIGWGALFVSVSRHRPAHDGV